MSDTSLIHAKSAAYSVLGRMLCDGLTPETVPLLLSFDDETVPAMDSLKADYYRVFGLNVYPYAGVFLSDDALMGGAEAEASAAFYARAGWDAPPSDLDHIGTQLGVLGWLTGAEADALADGKPTHITRIHALRRDFLDRRVLTWLPALAHAVEAHASPAQSRIAQLSLELALDDRVGLGEAGEVGFVLPVPPDVLADSKTSLRDIADYVMTPAWSGVYLSREDVGRLAARHGLPTGFTDRKTVLHNVFRAAVDYGAFPALMTDLCDAVQGWAGYFHDLAAHPILRKGCAVWEAQATRTLDMLRRVENPV